MRPLVAAAVTLALCLARAGSAEAFQPARPPLQVGIGYVQENLSNGAPTWREWYVDATLRLQPRKVVFGVVRLTERFGLSDQEFSLGVSAPAGERWTAMVEASYSPSHLVLPQWSAAAFLHRSFGPWGAQAGVRHRAYTAASVEVASLMIERYWSSYRAAYTLSVSQLNGANTTVAHAVQFNYYYGDRSSAALTVAAGREAEATGGGAVSVFNVRSIDASIVHWVRPTTAVTVGVGAHEVEGLYTRTRMQAGVRWQF
jgi:YaiO family outer membrane protein